MKINGKAMKPSCPDTCHLKCLTKIDEDERKKIFRDYWEIADKREQQYFLVSHVQELPSCRKRVGTQKRNTTFHYHFQTSKGSKVQLCRTFLSTHWT